MILRPWLRPRTWWLVLKQIPIDVIVFIIIVLTFIAVNLVTPADEAKPSPKVPELSEPAKNPPKEKQFTVDMALSAVVRTTSAGRVCYDSEQNAFYMHWAEGTHETRKGWYMMTDVLFHHSANGTVFIKDVNSIPDFSVGIDPINLPCKKGQGK